MCAGYGDLSGTFDAGCFWVCPCGVDPMAANGALHLVVGDCPYVVRGKGVSNCNRDIKFAKKHIAKNTKYRIFPQKKYEGL